MHFAVIVAQKSVADQVQCDYRLWCEIVEIDQGFRLKFSRKKAVCLKLRK